MDVRSRRSAAAGSRRLGVATLTTALGLLYVAGCGLSGPNLKEARVVVESDNRNADVQIVTSTEFAVTEGSQTPTDPSGSGAQFIAADTTVQTLPFERTFDIRSTGRFFIRAQIPAAATDTPSVNTTIRVFVDGEQRNLVQGDLANDPVQAVFMSDV